MGRTEYKLPHCSNPGNLIDITSLRSRKEQSKLDVMYEINSFIDFLGVYNFIYIFHCRNNAQLKNTPLTNHCLQLSLYCRRIVTVYA